MRDSEVTNVALIARPHLSYRGEQSTWSAIDRRFSSVQFDGSAPPAGRDFLIRKSAAICGGLCREPSVGGRTFELADTDGIVRWH
jgi:hypothetical protein